MTPDESRSHLWLYIASVFDLTNLYHLGLDFFFGQCRLAAGSKPAKCHFVLILESFSRVFTLISTTELADIISKATKQIFLLFALFNLIGISLV